MPEAASPSESAATLRTRASGATFASPGRPAPAPVPGGVKGAALPPAPKAPPEPALGKCLSRVALVSFLGGAGCALSCVVLALSVNAAHPSMALLVTSGGVACVAAFVLLLFLRRNGGLEQERLQTTEALKESQRQMALARDREVEVAARIQRTLLLDEPPADVAGIVLDAMTIPSQAVDGDFYNFFVLGPGQLDLLMGDVMGKGIPAALVGAAVKSTFLRAELDLLVGGNDRLLEPATILTAVHGQMTDELITLGSFMTLHYVRFDMNRMLMTFVDCGQTPIIHYRARTGSCWMRKGRNLPLGFTREETYGQVAVPLEAGDVLVFYSDGITETMNAQGELFGEERLAAIVRQNARREPAELLRLIRNTIVFFSGADSFRDDVTCIAVKVQPPPVPFRTERMRFASGLSALSRLRRFVARSVGPDFGADEVDRAVLAAQEAATNIILHAQKHLEDEPVSVEVGLAADWYFLRFLYRGRQFDWAAQRDPEFGKLAERGYGMFIMAHAMDSASYCADNRGMNEIVMSRFHCTLP